MFIAHTAELASGPVHYHEGGSGPPILHLHPAVGPRISPVVERLAARHTVFMPTAPGFNATPMHAGVKTMMDLADLMAAFVRQIVGGKCDVVAESFGGWVALWLAAKHPGRVWFFAGYDESLAHWIEGASDLFLMPSLYEPCGLNQMYSLRYGTIPIVRNTGGLADSVQHFDPATGAGTGIVFNDFDSGAMSWALDTAMQWYLQLALWERLVQNAMRMDFSWETQCNEYLKLFAGLLQLDAASLIKRNPPQKAAG